MDTEEYRKKIEFEILQIIEERLKAGEMDAERAKEIAKYILDSLHPPMELEQVREVAKNLDKHFPELRPIVIQTSREHDEAIKTVIGEHVGQLLKQNKVSQASDILDKTLNKKVL